MCLGENHTPFVHRDQALNKHQNFHQLCKAADQHRSEQRGELAGGSNALWARRGEPAETGAGNSIHLASLKDTSIIILGSKDCLTEHSSLSRVRLTGLGDKQKPLSGYPLLLDGHWNRRWLEGGLGRQPRDLPKEFLCSLLLQFTAWELSIIKTLRASSKSF